MAKENKNRNPPGRRSGRSVNAGKQKKKGAVASEEKRMTTRNRGRKGNSTQERALQPLAGPNASAPKVGGKPTESPSTSASLNQELEAVTNLTALAEFLSNSHQGRDVNLHNREVDGPVKSSKGCATWRRSVALMPQKRSSPQLSSQAADGVFSLKKCPAKHHLCTVSGAGTRVSNANLTLEDAVLVFDGTCTDVHLKKSPIDSGVIVCHGACSVTFTSCRFESITLVALAGAQVTLTDCHFDLSYTDNDTVAVFVSGEGTGVTMRECTIDEGSVGVVVEAGASLEAHSLNISGALDTGARVTGSGSVLKLHDSTVEDLGHDLGSVEHMAGHAVFVCAGAEAELIGVHLLFQLRRAVVTAVVVSGAKATIRDCEIQGCVASALEFGEGATGSVENCNVTGPGAGVIVSEAGTAVVVARCHFHGMATQSVAVQNGGVLRVQECTNTGTECGTLALAKGEDTQMQLDGCTSEGGKFGCVCMDHAVMTLNNVSVCNCDVDAFSVEGAAAAYLHGCRASDVGSSGMWAVGSGTRVEMRSCAVVSAQSACVEAYYGARMLLHECTLSYAVIPSAIDAQGEGTFVEAEGCILARSARGAVASELAEVKLTKCTSRWNEKEAFLVESRGRMSVIDCTSDGDGAVGGGNPSGVLHMHGLKCTFRCHACTQVENGAPSVASCTGTRA